VFMTGWVNIVCNAYLESVSLTASALIYLLAKLPSISKLLQHCIEFYLWLFLKVSRKYPSLVRAWLSRCRILWFQSSRSFCSSRATGTGLLGRAALAPPPPAIGTDFSIVSFAMLLACAD
jgi:hypothetical protein